MSDLETLDRSRIRGYHQNWYAVALANELAPGALLGADFLGGRIVVYRTASGSPVVLTGICPHLGLDLSLGRVIGDEVRCAQHHFRFGPDGQCTGIPSGGRVSKNCRVFRYPTVERWGLIWAFNGSEPLFDLPSGIRGLEEPEWAVLPRRHGIYHNAPWVVTSQLYDWQHLRYVHGMEFDDEPEIRSDESGFHRSYDITFSLSGVGRMTQLIDNFGTNCVTYLTRKDGTADSAAIFTSTPTIDDYTVQTYYCVAAPRSLPAETLQSTLQTAADLADQIGEEDRAAVNGMRFRMGALTPDDQGLVRYFRWVREFPLANPGADFQ